MEFIFIPFDIRAIDLQLYMDKNKSLLAISSRLRTPSKSDKLCMVLF